jgi:predicted  nucleic acid-binding Zn-ribbon protein
MAELTRDAMKPLLELQRLDTAIDRLTERRAHLPEQQELDDLGEQRAEVSTRFIERTGAFDEVARKQARLEADIEQIRTKMTREEERRTSGAVSSPRELVNIQAELDALRRRRDHLEDDELEIMEQRELLEKEVGELQAELDVFDAKIADATERRDAAAVEIEKDLGELRAQRDALAPTIHPEAFELYEDLRVKKNGVAVGALESGTCRACSLPLSPVALDQIKRSDDPIVRCENCRRLLIVP